MFNSPLEDMTNMNMTNMMNSLPRAVERCMNALTVLFSVTTILMIINSIIWWTG